MERLTSEQIAADFAAGLKAFARDPPFSLHEKRTRDRLIEQTSVRIQKLHLTGELAVNGNNRTRCAQGVEAWQDHEEEERDSSNIFAKAAIYN